MNCSVLHFSKKSILIILYIYHHILFPSQPEVSHSPFVGLHFFNVTFVITIGLDARLIEHINHQLVTGRVCHLACHGHHSFAPVQILHMMMNKAIISRMSN